MRDPLKPSFNKEWVKTKTEKEFVDTFKDVYPEVDLAKTYKDIVGKPNEADKK